MEAVDAVRGRCKIRGETLGEKIPGGTHGCSHKGEYVKEEKGIIGGGILEKMIGGGEQHRSEDWINHTLARAKS